MPRKQLVPTPTEPLTIAETEIAIAIPEPAIVFAPTHANVIVRPNSKWNSIQSAGTWLSKSSPVTVNISDPRLVEWRANPHLLVEEV